MDWKNELRLSRKNARSPQSRTDLMVTLVLILGLALNAWGIVFNGAVVITNNDTMPVVTERPIVLLENSGVPRTLISEGNLLLLADRIRINFPDIRTSVPGGYLGKSVRWWSKWLDYPLEGGLNMVSIGDLMRWSGTAVFLLLIPVILVRITWRLLSGDLPRIFTS